MKAIDRYKKVQELKIDTVPYNVWTTFECEQKYLSNQGIQIMGEFISLGGDYKNLDEIKESLEWLVDQFGGKVKWGRK